MTSKAKYEELSWQRTTRSNGYSVELLNEDYHRHCPVCLMDLGYWGDKGENHHWSYDPEHIVKMCSTCHRHVVHYFGPVERMTRLAESIGLSGWIDVALISAIRKTELTSHNIEERLGCSWYIPDPKVRGYEHDYGHNHSGLSDFL